MNSELLSVQTLVSVLQGVLIVAISVLVARLKERPPIFWGMMSLFFGIYALFILVLLPPSKKRGSQEKEKKESSEGEQPLPAFVEPKVEKVPEFSTDALSLADWFYLDDKKNVIGPKTLNEMQKLVQDLELTGDSWVWCEVLPSWKKVKDLPQIASLLGCKVL